MVEHVFSWNDGKVTYRYHGLSPQNPGFGELREGLLD